MAAFNRPLSALVSAVALERLGARLWPEQASAGRLGSLMWASIFFAALYMTGVTSDIVSLALISCGCLPVYRAVQDGSTWRWLGWGAASGLAVLANGPVAVLYVVPPILALPLWALQLRPRASRLGPPLGGFVFVAIPLCWIYAASQKQGLHIGAFVRDWVAVAPPRPMGASRFAYWYVPLLAGMLFPWSLWPPFWRASAGWKLLWRERSSRLLVVAVVVPLVALSAARENHLQQLIPIIAGAMLLAGRLLAEHDVPVSGWAPIFPALLIGGSGMVVHMLVVAGGAHIPAWISEPPWWVSACGFLIAMTLVSKGARAAEPEVHRTAVAAVAFAALIVARSSEVLGPRYDVNATARYIDSMHRSGHPIAHVAPYDGEFGYLGRLGGQVTQISEDDPSTWLRAHPDGLLIVRDRSALDDRRNVLVYRQPYKGDALLMYQSAGAAAQSISED